MSQGVRNTCHVEAYIVRGLAGSATMSAAPVLSSTKRIFAHVCPPSFERNTPRSWFGPYGWPIAATYTRFASVGSTYTLPIWLVSRRPTLRQVRPPSVVL